MRNLMRFSFATLSLCVLGVVLSAAQTASAQNLVTNGSFETGSLSGWQASGNVEARNDEGATDGSFSAVFNAAGGTPDGRLSQSFATTPGKFYQVRFDYGTFGTGSAQRINAIVNNQGHLFTSAAPSQPASFTGFAVTFRARASTSPVTFSDLSDNSTVGADGVLDNVRMLAVDLVISEFRLSGPGGANDKFVEFYNRTGDSLDISNMYVYLLRNDTGVAGRQIPAGAVVPARTHYLFAFSAYSLAASAAPDAADPMDRSTYFSGVGLFIDAAPDTSMRLDAVRFNDVPDIPADLFVRGFTEGTPLPQTGVNTVEHGWVRKANAGVPQDTNDNLNDFVLVSTTGAAIGGVQSTLGAPGPQNLSAPAARDQVKASLLAPAKLSSESPNRQRDGTPVTNGASGMLRIRRTFRNTTGGSITALRFRVIDITTLNSPGYSPGNGQADLRVVASPSGGDFSVTLTDGSSVPVKGTQVEQPPNQPNGGGLNSSIVTVTPVTPIAAGQSVNVEFTLGVQQAGTFRFFVNAEALSGASPSPAAARSGRVRSSTSAKR